jgi:GTP-binding protein LepA
MLRALIFDSFFDKHRGVIAFVRIFEGEMTAGDMVHFLGTDLKANIQEVGFFTPEMTKSAKISNGEVGYMITGLKDLSIVRVGDTICSNNDKTNAMAGYKKVEPKVFSSLFPIDADDYPKLRESIAKLKLNDASLFYEVEHIPALGYGYRCGFLGLLHLDIVQERLSREFDLDLVVTTPSVEYKVLKSNDELISVHTPSELPDPSQIKEIREPWIKIEILTPEDYIGKIIELITFRRGAYHQMNSISAGQIQIVGEMPLAEMIVDFYDDLKSATKGYATMSYELLDYRAEALVKIDILVNHNIVEALSVMAHKSSAEVKGNHICKKLKELIPRQQFDIPIQAAIGVRIIGRETIKAFRKDVTAKLYGGDHTRRQKLLSKQKEGKKRMKMVGNVEIPQSAFLNVLKK